MAAFNGNTFTYDARGRRTGKNGITFTYALEGKLVKQSNGLEFFYDHTGVFALKQGAETYYCRKDAQNNVIALLDNEGAVVVQYKYDAWGNQLVLDATGNAIADPTHIGNLNPFRYRSYYYDTETGLYFLQTRYYDPEICRFMTIDDIAYLDPETVNGLNLYAYCGNNPIMHIDPNGNVFITLSALLLGAAISALIGAGIGMATTIYKDYKDDGEVFNGSISWRSYVGNVLGGAIAGAGIGVCITLGAGVGASL